MPKKNPTTDYLQRKKPDSIWQRREFSGEVPPNRFPLPRLSWLVPNPQEIDEEKLIWIIREAALPSATFFLDTCFVRNSNLSEAFWKCLFEKKVVITERIWTELQLWIQQPLNDRNKWLREKLIKERAEPSGCVIFLDKFLDDNVEMGCVYYMRVLARRKQVHQLVSERLTEKLGRDPLENETKSEVQRWVKNRGIQLAQDGIKAAANNSSNTYNDEDLVARAVVHGIASGDEVTILTTDRGVLEQFYKLIYLIDTNYRSMLVAEEFVKQPDNFPQFPTEPEMFSCFGLENCTQIKLPRGFDQQFLPNEFDFVMLYCNRFGSVENSDVRHDALAFCAEREMIEVVKIKGKTNGLNTDLLEGRNCIHHLSPAIPLNGICLVADENSVTEEKMSIADCNIALFEGEGISHFEGVIPANGNSEDEKALQIAESLIAFTPEVRLSVTPIPELPHLLTKKEVAYAFKLIEPSTLFAFDSSALAYRWPEKVRQSFSGKQLAVHPETFEFLDLSHSSHQLSTFWPRSTVNSEQFEFVYRYYRTLLLQRRFVGASVAKNLDSSLGKTELQLAWQTTFAGFKNGSKAIRRATSGWKRANSLQLFYDDIALVDTILTAILEGTNLVFVTLRTSVFEQFYTLVNLLLKQYESFLLADAIYKQGTRFPAPEPSVELRSVGLDSEMHKVTIESTGSPHLPVNQIDFTLSCWLLFPDSKGETFQFRHGCFLAERPMWKLLETKSRTRGQSSQHHGEYNFRIFSKNEKHKQVGIAKDWIRPVGKSMPNVPKQIIEYLLDDVSAFDLIDVQNHCDPLDFHW